MSSLCTVVINFTNLVRVLAGRGHTHGARPVVVEVRQLVRQLLEVLRLEAAGVLQHVVAGGVDGALPDALADQEEVVPGKTMSFETGKTSFLPLWQSDHIVHHSPTGRVLWLGAGLEEPRVDPLADHDIRELQLVVHQSSLLETLLGKVKRLRGGNFDLTFLDFNIKRFNNRKVLTLMEAISWFTT